MSKKCLHCPMFWIHFLYPKRGATETLFFCIVSNFGMDTLWEHFENTLRTKNRCIQSWRHFENTFFFLSPTSKKCNVWTYFRGLMCLQYSFGDTLETKNVSSKCYFPLGISWPIFSDLTILKSKFDSNHYLQKTLPQGIRYWSAMIRKIVASRWSLI